MESHSGWWPTKGRGRPEPALRLPRTVADVIRQHATLEVEGIDRRYLNVYPPNVQRERDVFRFLRDQRGQGAVSSRCFAAMTPVFVPALDDFAQKNGIPLRTFAKQQRKEEIAKGVTRMSSSALLRLEALRKCNTDPNWLTGSDRDTK
jgi:hypothetical protein